MISGAGRVHSKERNSGPKKKKREREGRERERAREVKKNPPRNKKIGRNKSRSQSLQKKKGLPCSISFALQTSLGRASSRDCPSSARSPADVGGPHRQAQKIDDGPKRRDVRVHQFWEAANGLADFGGRNRFWDFFWERCLN